MVLISAKNRHETIWNSCWNSDGEMFALAGERGVSITNIETNRSNSVFNKGDVLSVKSSPLVAYIYYIGTRGGNLSLYDSRTPTPPCHITHLSSPLIDLYPFKDDVYLLSSQFNGIINKWDLRNAKSVLSFGCKNEYLINTRLNVNLTEDVVVYGSKEGSIKFWDLYDGTLIYDMDTDIKQVRSVFYSDLWYKHPGGRTHLSSNDEYINQGLCTIHQSRLTLWL
eukprot:TRINITY_DN5358_c0_g1_i1.p1 TRINITY_DN5358_c0_g1~~TRINITY_DN5358_c0_g1_i1.p1  ORF type:complete len:224 (-),score=38.68 TRINITY_DN5358_c0_g1_i1:138-809(-)